MSRNSINSKRLSGLSWLGMSMFAVAGISQARVQLIQRDDILKRATSTDRFLVSRTEFAKRGGILDREGKPLAQDEDTRFLTIQFAKTPKSPAFYMDMAAATGIPATEFAALAESKAPVDWKKPIGSAQASAVQDVKQRWRADGVGLSRSGRRNYPLGEAGAGFIGAMRDKTALSGIELGLNKSLSGMDGKIVGIVDREGNYLPMRLDRQTVRREDGATLTLTIDSEIQQAAAEAVKHAVDANKADQGVAIVMDPKNGDILAMANWPSFDPNKAIEPKKDSRTPEFNGAYMAALEPGSTFKVLTLAKALDAGVVLPDDTYYCKGSIQIRNRVISCDSHHGNRAHGLLTAESAIARSCNLAAANWARKVGHDDFVHYMENLGLMEKPGIGLPQESRGLYNYNDYTKDVQLATNGFGQSMNYTPLALCSAFSTLANDGKRVFPRIVEKVDDKAQAPKVGEQVLGPAACHTVLHMMTAVIDSDRGTGKSLRIPGYEIGGKTGTAQKKNYKTGQMKGGGYVSNFVGFVPAEKPQAVILVMIDNPKAGLFYGATVAGPVFKSIAQNVIRRLHVPRADGKTTDSFVEEPASRTPLKAPAPFVPEESEQDSTRPERPAQTKGRAPKVEVEAKPMRSQSRVGTAKLRSSEQSKPTPKRSSRTDGTLSREEVTVAPRTKRSTTPAKSEPASTKRTKSPAVAQVGTRRHESITTETSRPQRIARQDPNVVVVPNPKRTTRRPAKTTATTATKPATKRSIVPRVEDLRKLGRTASNITTSSSSAQVIKKTKKPATKIAPRADEIRQLGRKPASISTRSGSPQVLKKPVKPAAKKVARSEPSQSPVRRHNPDAARVNRDR